jgi:hypothetical protein
VRSETLEGSPIGRNKQTGIYRVSSCGRSSITEFFVVRVNRKCDAIFGAGVLPILNDPSESFMEIASLVWPVRQLLAVASPLASMNQRNGPPEFSQIHD